MEWGTRKRAALATRGSYDVLLLQRASLVTRRWRNAQRAAAAMSNAPLQQRAAVATRQYSNASQQQRVAAATRNALPRLLAFVASPNLSFPSVFPQSP